MTVLPLLTLFLSLFVAAEHVEARTASSRLKYASRAAANPPCPHRAYVALGDVFAAGMSSGEQLPECGTVHGPMCTPSNCARNKGSYPYQFYTANPTFPFAFTACADANTTTTVQNQISNSSTGGGPWAPQVDLVTMSIGANDVGLFSNAVQDCMMESPGTNCNATLSNSAAVIKDTLPSNLEAVFAAVHAKVMANATVLVMGYPLMFGNNTVTCSRMTVDVMKAMDANIAAVNTALQSKAAEHDFVYVDNTAGFNGHAVCDAEPWLQYSQMNGTSASAGYLHPTSDGSDALRASFKNAVCGY